MFELYDKVMIISKQLTGTIVDISTVENEKVYIVESNSKRKDPDGYGGVWPLYDCRENEIVKIV